MAKRKSDAEVLPASESPGVVVSTDTPEVLAENYLKVQEAINVVDAPAKWRWSKRVSDMLDCTADKSERTAKSEQIGAVIGNALRGKPYSGSWVRLHVMAYKAFPGGLDGTNPEDNARFMAILTGNAAKKAAKEQAAKEPVQCDGEPSEDTQSEKDFLGDVRAAIRRALGAGISVQDVTETCTSAINRFKVNQPKAA